MMWPSLTLRVFGKAIDLCSIYLVYQVTAFQHGKVVECQQILKGVLGTTTCIRESAICEMPNRSMSSSAMLTFLSQQRHPRPRTIFHISQASQLK